MNAGIADDGTPGAHAGIAQWDKTRREAIEAHFGVKLAAMSYDRQLEAVHYELTQGLAKKAGDKLRQETTAAGSSSSVAHNFEIPVGANDPDAAAKWAKEKAWRRQYAEAHLAAYPGADKRALDHTGSFWDGLRNPPPQLSMPGKPWWLVRCRARCLTCRSRRCGPVRACGAPCPPAMNPRPRPPTSPVCADYSTATRPPSPRTAPCRPQPSYRAAA